MSSMGNCKVRWGLKKEPPSSKYRFTRLLSGVAIDEEVDFTVVLPETTIPIQEIRLRVSKPDAGGHRLVEVFGYHSD